MLKWLPKVMKTDPKWSPGAPRVDLFFSFMHFGRCRKKMIFRGRPGRPKKKKNRDMWRHRVDFVAATDRQVVHFWPGGSQGPPRARGLVKKKTTEEQLVRDLTRHGPLARRILLVNSVIPVFLHPLSYFFWPRARARWDPPSRLQKHRNHRIHKFAPMACQIPHQLLLCRFFLH